MGPRVAVIGSLVVLRRARAQVSSLVTDLVMDGAGSLFWAYAPRGAWPLRGVDWCIRAWSYGHRMSVSEYEVPVDEYDVAASDSGCSFMRRSDRGHHGIGMGKVDQFESIFRAAAKTRFEYSPVQVESVLVVSDRDERAAAEFGDGVRSQLAVLERGEHIRWRVVHGGEYDSVPALLELVEAERPGLICTYRHLHSDSWQWPYTLGEYIDVLTQVTSTPIMVLPHPERQPEASAVRGTKVVMAMTDHLVGDHALVNWAARLTGEGGRLVLSNVEDDTALDRFMEAVGRIPSIDTDSTRLAIEDRLERDARDFMLSCSEEIMRAALPISVESVVAHGHHLTEYSRLVEEHDTDLLVMHTKDEDQLAMHGLAYPLAIEVRSVPLLLL